jgi:endonuclease/exonuclease/phosphatase (EEP) superfamily protein YafD
VSDDERAGAENSTDKARDKITDRGSNRVKRILVVSLGVLVITHSTLVLAYYFGHAIWGNRIWLVDAVGYMLTFLFIPSLLLLPLAIFSRAKVLISLAAVPVLLFLLTYGRLYLPRAAAAEASPTFTVMTYNVLDINRQYDGVAQQIIDYAPDILGLHELQAHMIKALEERLADRFPYREVEPGRGLFSRYPIRQYRAFQLAEYGHWAQQAIFTIDGRDVTLLNVHPRTPRVVYENPLGLPSNLARDKRDRDYVDLINRVGDIGGPLIVMGDMNLTDRHEQYAELRKYLEDAHRDRGFGLGFTRTNYPRIGLPTWRIDYIFYTADMVALDVGVGEFAGSDHRPVVAQLGFPVDQ